MLSNIHLTYFHVEFEGTASKRLTQVLELANTAINANAIAIITSKEHNSKLKEAMDVSMEVVSVAVILSAV